MTEHHRVTQLGPASIYSGTVPMIIPTGGPIQRHAELRLPLFSEPPDVNATVFSTESPGPAFAVFSIQVNADEVATQIDIDAQSTDDSLNVEYQYWCSYIVIAKPAR